MKAIITISTILLLLSSCTKSKYYCQVKSNMFTGEIYESEEDESKVSSRTMKVNDTTELTYLVITECFEY